MMHVVICDDNERMVEYIETIIDNTIFIEEKPDVCIELATTDYHEVLDLFFEQVTLPNGKNIEKRKPLKHRIIFLDIHFLNQPNLMNGIKLARKIRRYDVKSDIVFVTNDVSKKNDLIEKKILPLGYILKTSSSESFKNTILTQVAEAKERQRISTFNDKMIEIETHRSLKYVNFDEVCFIKANNSKSKDQPGLCLLCYADGRVESLTRRLKHYEEGIPELIKLGRSALINPRKIKQKVVTAKGIKVTMANGDILSADSSSYLEYERLLAAYKT